MTEAQRIDYLIKVLEGDNARAFADKIGVSPKTVSYLRHGKTRVGLHADRICAAYPEIRKDWLLVGRGDSGIPQEKVLSDYESEVERLKRLVDNLSDEIKAQRAVIRMLMKEK